MFLSQLCIVYPVIHNRGKTFFFLKIIFLFHAIIICFHKDSCTDRNQSQIAESEKKFSLVDNSQKQVLSMYHGKQRKME